MVNLSVSSESTQTPVRTKVATWSELSDRAPAYALVGNVDLVVIRYDEEVSVLYGRCQHRDALMADGTIDGNNLICGVHGWDYRYDTGVSEYNNNEQLEKFTAVIDRDKDAVLVDASEIASFEKTHPQYFDRDEYLGLYQDLHGGAEEPKNAYIQSLAMGSARRAITGRSRQWECRSRLSPGGMTFKSSRRSWLDRRFSTKRPSAPSSSLGLGRRNLFAWRSHSSSAT